MLVGQRSAQFGLTVEVANLETGIAAKVKSEICSDAHIVCAHPT